MGVNFLFSYEPVSKALNENIKTDFALVSRECIQNIGEITSDVSDCDLWLTGQARDKIRDQLNFDQQIRFLSTFKEENKTRGVSGFNITSSITESAKVLSYMGNVLVIVPEEEKSFVPNSSRIITITPSEFLFIYEKSRLSYEKISNKRQSFIEVLLFVLIEDELRTILLQQKSNNNGK